MKKLVFYFMLLCFGANLPAQDHTRAQQLIPNTSFQVSTNEKVMATLLRKLGYSSINAVPAEKFKEVADKILKDTASYSKVDGWVIWRNLHQKTTQDRISEKIKDDSTRIYMAVSEPYFLGTYLNEAMQAGKQYNITLQFLHQPEIDKLTEKQMPTLGFCFLSGSPEKMQKHLKPQNTYKFKWNPDAKYYERRRKVIERHQKENGGNYEAKAWKEFQGIRTGKEKYETVKLTYRAQGGEKYLVFGNFTDKKIIAAKTINLTLYRLYIHEVGKASTLSEN